MRKKKGGQGISINEPQQSLQQESQPVTEDMPPPSQSQPSQSRGKSAKAKDDVPQQGKAKAKAKDDVPRQGKAKAKAIGAEVVSGKKGQGQAPTIKEPTLKELALKVGSSGTKKRTYGQFQGTKK